MSWFCRHQWRVLLTTVVQPLPLGKCSGGLAELKMYAKLARGQTTALVGCDKCGELRYREMLGVPEGEKK